MSSKALKNARDAVVHHKQLRKNYDLAVGYGSKPEVVLKAKDELVAYLIEDIMPAVTAVKAVNSFWERKEAELELELDSLFASDDVPSERKAGSKSGNGTGTKSTDTNVAVPPNKSRRGASGSADTDAAGKGTKPTGSGKRKNRSNGTKSSTGGRKKSSTGPGETKSIGGTAKKITDQSNRFTRKEEKNVDKYKKAVVKYHKHIKQLNQMSTPADIRKAKLNKWAQTVHLHLKLDYVAYAGSERGRIGKGKEHRDYPEVTITSAGPFNRDQEEEALYHARVALSQKSLFKDGNGKQTIRYDDGRKVDVVYRTLLTDEDLKKAMEELKAEDEAEFGAGNEEEAGVDGEEENESSEEEEGGSGDEEEEEVDEDGVFHVGKYGDA